MAGVIPLQGYGVKTDSRPLSEALRGIPVNRPPAGGRGGEVRSDPAL